jgi:hypothetical protein
VEEKRSGQAEEDEPPRPGLRVSSDVRSLSGSSPSGRWAKPLAKGQAGLLVRRLSIVEPPESFDLFEDVEFAEIVEELFDEVAIKLRLERIVGHLPLEVVEDRGGLE